MKLQEFTQSLEAYASFPDWQAVVSEEAARELVAARQDTIEIGREGHLGTALADELEQATEQFKLEVAADKGHTGLTKPFQIGLLRALDRQVEISRGVTRPQTQQFRDGTTLEFSGASPDLDNSDYCFGALDPLEFAHDLGEAIAEINSILRKPFHTSYAAILEVDKGLAGNVRPTDASYHILALQTKQWLDQSLQVVTDSEGRQKVDYEVPKLPMMAAKYNGLGSYNMRTTEEEGNTEAAIINMTIPKVAMMEATSRYVSPSKLLLGAYALNFAERQAAALAASGDIRKLGS